MKYKSSINIVIELRLADIVDFSTSVAKQYVIGKNIHSQYSDSLIPFPILIL